MEALTLQKLVQALQAYEPERVYLFGSWARGEADETSDLDVVVIKQTEELFWNESAVYWPCCRSIWAPWTSWCTRPRNGRP